MNTGWIKLHRKFCEWEWYDQPDTLRVFIHLLLNANHTKEQWCGITINPGQIIIGRTKLSKELKLTERKIRTSLNRLKTTKEIAIKTTNKFSIVTICKWEEYQSKEDDERPAKRPAKRLSNDQQTTTNKNDKNVKKIKNKIKLHSEKFKNFTEVVSYFDSKFINEKEWLDCYDKLIRIDKYSEDRILKIVKEFRSDGNWWKDNGNFESLLKLRKKNNDKIKYIDLFDKKLNNSSGFNPADSRTQPDMKNFNPKF